MVVSSAEGRLMTLAFLAVVTAARDKPTGRQRRLDPLKERSARRQPTSTHRRAVRVPPPNAHEASRSPSPGTQTRGRARTASEHEHMVARQEIRKRAISSAWTFSVESSGDRMPLGRSPASRSAATEGKSQAVSTRHSW